jgi:hypothetical protein
MAAAGFIDHAVGQQFVHHVDHEQDFPRFAVYELREFSGKCPVGILSFK